MRYLVLLALPILIGTAQAQSRDQLFISPMGEPFLGSREALPWITWFDQADTDHDGKLTPEEFQADAARFYQTLDADRSGEIDPQENQRYEIMLDQAVSDRSNGSRGLDRSVNGPDSLSGGPPGSTRYARTGGISRYHWLGMLQPVMSADLNFNRGVSPSEFARAADARFRLLDANGDGVLEKSELPPR